MKSEDIVHNLDFDKLSNKEEFEHLKETLFYQSFTSKTFAFTKKFSEIQQLYTKRFKSGLVVPIILHEIPFALICVGSEKEGIFSEDDRQVACTFADAISEFIRLERILHTVATSQKIIVMEDSIDMIEELKKVQSKEIKEKETNDEPEPL